MNTTSSMRRGRWAKPAVMVALTLIMTAGFTTTLYAGVIGDIIDSVLNLIVSWIASGIALLISFFLDGFMAALSTDMSVIVTALPGLETFHSIICGIGIALMCLIAVVQLFTSFTAGFGIEGEHPFYIFARMFLAALATIGGAALCKEILKFLSYPYFLLLTEGGLDGSNNGLTDTIYTNLTSGVDAGSKTINTIIGIILLVIVAWNLMKLVIECVKRYVYCGILVYLSPLAFSTLTSKATSRIAGSYVSMFMGHGLMLVLNVWCVSMVVNAVGAYGSFVNTTFNIANTATGGTIALEGGFFLWTLIVIALIKFGLGLEETMNKVGLHTTGSRQLSGAALMGAATLMRMLGGCTRGSRGGGKSDGGLLGGAIRGMSNAGSKVFDGMKGNTPGHQSSRSSTYAADVASGAAAATTGAAKFDAAANKAQTQAMAGKGKGAYNASRAQFNDIANGKKVAGMQNTMNNIDKRDDAAISAAKNINQAAGDHLAQFDGVSGQMDLNHVVGVSPNENGTVSVFAPAKGPGNEGKIAKAEFTSDKDYALMHGYREMTTTGEAGSRAAISDSETGGKMNPKLSGQFCKMSVVNADEVISGKASSSVNIARNTYNSRKNRH